MLRSGVVIGMKIEELGCGLARRSQHLDKGAAVRRPLPPKRNVPVWAGERRYPVGCRLQPNAASWDEAAFQVWPTE